MTGTASKPDVYAQVTTYIVNAIETAGAFQMPWITDSGTRCGRPVNIASKRAYNGINVLSLWITAVSKTYSSHSRQVRSRIIGKIRDERGKGVLSDLRTDHIRKDVRALTPGAASNRLKAWRGMFRFAVDEGLIPSDPSRDVKAPKGEVVGHRQWTKDEIAVFREYWPNASRERIAFEVIYWTGARCSDAACLGTPMLDKSGWLTFVQEKTQGKVTLPLLCPLPSWAQSLAIDQKYLQLNLPSDMIWITTQYGKPRSVKGLSQWMSRSATTAGLPKDCTAHGLRKARAAALAEAGAPPHQIGAWTGHTSLSEVSHYTRQADLRSILSGPEQEQNMGNRSK
jgi:integrase/recombinase XerD